jgi:CBS domain-containing protein
MTNRRLAYIIKDQRPIVLLVTDTIQNACRCMHERQIGSVLVIDDHQHLKGIFTGRDAVRALADGRDATKTLLSQVMTPDPVTVGPHSRAIDALRAMNDGGFRHMPVVDEDRIWGVVSRGDFCGIEIDRLEEEIHLAETIW